MENNQKKNPETGKANIKPDKTNSSENKNDMMDDIMSLFTSQKFVVTMVVIYLLIVVVLILAESGVEQLAAFRATDRKLMLFVLLFVPFFLLAAPKLVDNFTLRFGGGKEFQLKLTEVRQEVREKVESTRVDVEKTVSKQLGTSEQAFWPLLAGINSLAAQRLQQERPQLIIGAKEFASQAFFAHFLKQWLQEKLPGVKCVTRVPNGGSLKNFADVKNHWIDLYVDYTGTLFQYFRIDHHQFEGDPDSEQKLVELLNKHCKEIGLEFLSPVGASESYLLVVREELATEFNIQTISDLAPISPELTFSCDPEFYNRSDCWVGLQQAYGMTFKDVKICSVTDRYRHYAGGEAEVFVGFETDQQLAQLKLTVLRDDEHFFPSYNAGILASSLALETVSGLKEALIPLAQAISNDDLIQAVHRIRAKNGDLKTILETVDKQYWKITGERLS